MKTRAGIAPRSNRSRRGAATVELAILAPILVVLVLWANYFWEVQRARLKAAELARFVAFERTVRPDPARIAAEAHERYKDLDGSTKTGELGTAYRNRLTLSVRAEDVEAPLTESGLADRSPGGIGAVMTVMGSTAGEVAQQMGLNPRSGAVQADVTITLENGIIPDQIALYTTGFMDDTLDLQFTERFYLFHDTWRAWEHGDAPSDSYPRVEQRTYERVDRITFAGVGGGSAANAIGDVLSVLGLDFPLSDSYIRDSVMIRPVHADGRYPAEGPTRTVPGDVLHAAYWLNDNVACNGDCEPTAIQQKRGLINRSDYGDNWPMRAYNCRGPYFQGARKSEAPESEYSQASFRGHGDYHNYGGDNACQ